MSSWLDDFFVEAKILLDFDYGGDPVAYVELIGFRQRTFVVDVMDTREISREGATLMRSDESIRYEMPNPDVLALGDAVRKVFELFLNLFRVELL